MLIPFSVEVNTVCLKSLQDPQKSHIIVSVTCSTLGTRSTAQNADFTQISHVFHTFLFNMNLILPPSYPPSLSNSGTYFLLWSSALHPFSLHIFCGHLFLCYDLVLCFNYTRVRFYTQHQNNYTTELTCWALHYPLSHIPFQTLISSPYNMITTRWQISNKEVEVVWHVKIYLSKSTELSDPWQKNERIRPHQCQIGTKTC